MSRIYCTLNDVKRLLRSLPNQESRVRFSSAYRDLKPDDGNSGDIDLSGVSFVDSFSDHDTYTFQFTDSTSFRVTGEIIGSLGTGNRFSTFTATNRFSVPSENWSGAAITGDKVYITAASDISEDDGHQFVVDATKKINSRLSTRYGSLSNVSYYDSTSAELPDAVSYACSRIAAYEIFNSVFAGSAVDEASPVERWNKDAESELVLYLSAHGRGPIWKSRVSLVTEIGVSGVGDGVVEIDELPDPENKDYER